MPRRPSERRGKVYWLAESTGPGVKWSLALTYDLLDHPIRLSALVRAGYLNRTDRIDRLNSKRSGNRESVKIVGSGTQTHHLGEIRQALCTVGRSE